MINQLSEEQISGACSILARAKDVGAISGWQWVSGAGFFIRHRETKELIPLPYGHIVELFEDTDHLKELVDEVEAEEEETADNPEPHESNRPAATGEAAP